MPLESMANTRSSEYKGQYRGEAGPAHPRSRLNAVKHGLAGIGGVVSGHDPALESRLETWMAQIKPGTEEGRWALRQAVAETIRVEGCREALASAKSLRSLRAATPEGWDLDRKAVAARLAENLQARPELTVRQLEATKQGVEVLLDHWNRLGYALDAKQGWTDSELSIAHDLLAVPLHLRESGSPFENRPGCTLYEHRRVLAMDEVLRLQDRLKYTLEPINELERAQAESGVSFLASKEAGLILRYERDAIRRHDKFLAIAKASRIAPDEDETDGSDADVLDVDLGDEPERPADLDAHTAAASARLSRAERRQAARPAHKVLRKTKADPLVGLAQDRISLAKLLK